MGFPLSTLSLTLDVLTPLSQVLACIEWMLETCNVSGIYIYLRDLELCLQITMMSFSEIETAQWGYFPAAWSLYTGMFRAFFVISVKVGGVLFGSSCITKSSEDFAEPKCNKKVDFFGISKMRYRD